MTLFDTLSKKEMDTVNACLETVKFKSGKCIMEQGSEGRGCYFLDKGTVRVEFDTGELDTEVVLNYLEPGMVMGDFSLIDRQPRSASLFAHTDVKARWLSLENFEKLLSGHPKIGMQLLKSFSANLIQIVRHTNRQLADFISVDVSTPYVDKMVERARIAQIAFQEWPENKIDMLLKDVSEAVMSNALTLAADTVEESGLGVIADKVEKIRFTCQYVYQALAGRSASGTNQNGPAGLNEEIASPVGVIMGIIPLTSPVPTMLFKTLLSLKSRNALIVSCHRKSLKPTTNAGEIIQSVLKKHHAPADLVQWIREHASLKLTHMFMGHKDISLILATGGPSIVKGAYSSGKPAIGVGTGNAPVYIAEDADIDKAARLIVASKSFDNGIVNGSENNLVVHEAVYYELTDALKRHHAQILDPDEIDQLTEKMVDPEKKCFNTALLGLSTRKLAQKCGIDEDETVRLFIVPLEKKSVAGPFGQHKQAPVLSLFTVGNDEEGFQLCQEILNRQGSGHTAIIHTQNQDLAKKFAKAMPASRILMNAGGSTGYMGGDIADGASVPENASYINLLNIKRLAFLLS